MNRAFIFDMDGVMINSEPVWEAYEKKFLPELMGAAIYAQIKNDMLGNSVSNIYSLASSYGLHITKSRFEKIYDEYANLVYAEAKFTNDIKIFIDKLLSMQYLLGLVSSSRQSWIDLVLNRLDRNPFQYVLSVDNKQIKPKPSPEGYLKAIKALRTTANRSIILEDSQRGIDAAKASGAKTICLREHLPKGYVPRGADIYVETIDELIDRIESILPL